MGRRETGRLVRPEHLKAKMLRFLMNGLKQLHMESNFLCMVCEQLNLKTDKNRIRRVSREGKGCQQLGEHRGRCVNYSACTHMDTRIRKLL